MATVLRIVIGIVLIVGVGTAGAWWLARPTTPDAFYDPPADMPTEPGKLVRSEAFERGVPEGARAWRILYTTTGRDGASVLASAVVMTSADPQDTPRPVVAWAHGTLGIARGCAPSVRSDPFPNIPALAELIREKWIYVGADYAGLATQGPHTYLVGEDTARDVLDAVRAARQIEGLNVAPKTVVWGHSQGGHAALWAGIRAPSYAPDVNVVGVVALAPASDLPPLIVRGQSSTVGKIVSAYIAQTYAKVYPDSDIASHVSPMTQALIDDIAARCIGGPETLFSVAETYLLPSDGIFMRSPGEGPLGQRLRENTPRDVIEAPVLIAQGEADDLVAPDLQSAYVVALCAAGQGLDYRKYAGRDHVSLVAPESPASSDIVAWTRARFAGEPATTACPPMHAD